MSQSFDDYVQELRSGTPMEPTPPPGPKTPKTPKRPPKTASSGKPPQTARSMRQTNLISADMTIEPPLAMTARQLSNQSRQSRQSRGLPPAGRNSGLPDPTSISASPLAALGNGVAPFKPKWERSESQRGYETTRDIASSTTMPFGDKGGPAKQYEPIGTHGLLSATPHEKRSDYRPVTGASRLCIGGPATARDSTRQGRRSGQGTPRFAPTSSTPRGSCSRRSRPEISHSSQPRTNLSQQIKGYEEKMMGRDRKTKAPYFCEVESAETYAQQRGGGGSTLDDLNGPSDPVRTRHVRDLDMLPATPHPPPGKPSKREKKSKQRDPEAVKRELRELDDHDLGRTNAWRLDNGQTGEEELGELDVNSAKSKPLRLMPGSMPLTRPARLQMELLASILAGKQKGFIRSLLQQCSDERCRLSRDNLRQAIKMLNIDPQDELITILMRGQKYASDKDVASTIEQDICSKDYEAPLGDPYLNTPFGVAQDAVRGVEETHERLSGKWGSLDRAFEAMDQDHSGSLSYDEFAEAVRKACPVNLSDLEMQKLFMEVDKDNSGQVNYHEFTTEFGKGSIFVPEFLKPRSLRQSRGGPIWQWDVATQASNAKRPFEIIDKQGHKRYHCKASHSYKLPHAFTEDAIARKIHLCREEMEKLEDYERTKVDRELNDHQTYVKYGKGLSAPPPRSRAASRTAERPRSCRPPWATDESVKETYKYRINGTLPAGQ